MFVFQHYQLVVPVIIASLVLVYVRSSRTKYKPPPGPPGLPIIGNALQIPHEHMATYFRDVARAYGGIASLNVMGVPMLIIGNAKAAKEILEKRAAKSSDRPVLPYVRRYIDPSKAYWALHEQCDAFQIGRRLVTAAMSYVRAGSTEPLHRFEALLTIQHLINASNNWPTHINRLVASNALAAGFGVHCPNGDEQELVDGLASMNLINVECNFSGSIINFFPFLDWIPGPMPWRKRAQEFLDFDNRYYSKMIQDAVTGKASGINTWAAQFAKEATAQEDTTRFMKMIFSAAIETTESTIKAFILACVVYPDWISEVQKQIDDVVGLDRMPTFADRSRLPLVDAVIRETFRWRPPARLAVPHLQTVDDVIEYNGEQYTIRAGTIIFGPPWAIEHDPNVYAEPDRFDHKRWLNSNGTLIRDYETTTVFGYGRRLCPGSPFAERIIWISVAMLLWTFDIKKPEGNDPRTGRAYEYDTSDAAFHDGLGTEPLDFPVAFIPRSEKHVELARREWEDCEKDLNVMLPAAKE